jgi:hypothetical protein
MSGVMVEGGFGPREVAPESMWTGLTRYGTEAKSWQNFETRAQEGFLPQDDGLWLPALHHSEADQTALESTAATKSAAELLPKDRYQAVRNALSAMTMTESGCWVDTRNAADTDVLLDLTGIDTAHRVIETANQAETLRQCATEGCLYHRHYDLTLDVPSGRRALLYPNLEYFQESPDEVLTAWGDSLPSVEASRRALTEFRYKCGPFVPRNESLLTISGIAQINLLPTTGCWFVRSYYMTPVGVNGYKNWQYDGYGRLRIPAAIAEQYDYKSFAILAHRVTWALTDHPLSKDKGRVLNHRCGFRPCANPGHLVETNADTNILHGRMMSAAVDVMDDRLPAETGIKVMKRLAAQQDISVADIDRFWA